MNKVVRPTRLDHFPSGRGKVHMSGDAYLKKRSCGKTEAKPPSQAKNLQDWLEARGLPCEHEAKRLHRNITTMERATGTDAHYSR